MRLLRFIEEAGLDARDVSVILHTPTERVGRRVLPWLAAERPDLFDAYQSTHPANVEASVRKRRWLLSFVDIGYNRQCFAGLFEVVGSEVWSSERFRNDSTYRALIRAIGYEGPAVDEKLASLGGRRCFDLRASDVMDRYRGRLLLSRPSSRAYVRRAETLDIDILALSEEPLLVGAAPDWREIAFTASELRELPRAWAERLREWRGVYLIVDRSDGARYVGSAYGNDNLLGRWRAHVAGATGVTAELSRRRTESFRFSILERVSPDLPPNEVIALERTWMDRLATIEYGLNT